MPEPKTQDDMNGWTVEQIEVLARAWDDGYDAGYDTGQDDAHDPSRNPYRWLLGHLAVDGSRS